MDYLKLVIKQCFENIYFVAKADARKNFKEDKKAGNMLDIARALVVLGDVAKNPDKYFSVESTNAAWDARVENYIKNTDVAKKQIEKYGIKYVRAITKGSIVESPCSIVFNKVSPVFKDREFWCFCEEVENFYYRSMDKHIFVNEAYIRDYADKIAAWTKTAKQKNPVKYFFSEWLNGVYQR